MRALSTHRRHPLAGVLVLLLGLVAVGGLYSALAPRTAQADSAGADAELVAAGRELYLVGCASCHGLNGQGILQSKSGQYGPSLIGVGAAAVDFQVGTGRMPMASNSQQAPRKEPFYDDAETEQLAAFVATEFGPGPAIPGSEYYDIADVSEEEVTRGGEFFLTNCTACHNAVGIGGALGGGRYAPSLEGVEGVHFAEAMITGPQSMPVFSDAVISPEDKRNIYAYLNEVQTQPASGGFALGGVGPVGEGLAGWVAGIGSLVVFAVWIGKHSVRARKP
ncbi:MAG: cytochrome c [Actinomycetota bacterium]|nr:cytochrome c [Actinomycetota bacterium]